MSGAQLTGIAIDGVNGRAPVTDRFLQAAVAVDLATGARTIVSDATTPDGVNPLRDPSGIALDAESGRLLVIDLLLRAVVAGEPTSGDRVSVSH